MRRLVQKVRRLIVSWSHVDLFFIYLASLPEVFLSSSMAAIDTAERPRWILIINPPVLAHFSGLVFRCGSAVIRLFVSLKSTWR